MRILYFVLLLIFYCALAFSDEKINLEQAVKDLSAEDYETRVKAKKIIESSGLRAIPILRNVVKSEELETQEFAEKKISECISYEKDQYKIQTMLGSDPKLISTHKYLNEYFNFLKEFILKSYIKNSLKDPRWDAQLRKMIPLWVEYYKNVEIDSEINEVYQIDIGHRKKEMETRKLINEITALGCDDPLFLFFKSSLYFTWFDFRFSMDDLSKASEDLVKANYSHYFHFYTLSNTIVAKVKVADLATKEAKTLEIFKEWQEIGKEEFVKTRIGQRRYVWWLTTFISDLQVPEFEANLEKISENIGKGSWADHLIRAHFLIKKAWYLRETSQSSSETALFRDNMQEAAVHAKAAALMIPEFPEAYLLIIKTSLTVKDNDRARLWFEKAFKAEANNANVFSEYLGALYPRFSGSTNEMLSLGREYLIINNPNLNTAKFYMLSLQKIKAEGSDIYQIPGLLNELEWAVEQQLSFKPAFPALYYNEIAMTAFKLNDFAKTLKAIQDTKGLFSTGWFSEKEKSAYIENFVTIEEKYKKTNIGQALRRFLANEDLVENFKAILDNFEKEIEPIDQPKLVTILMGLKVDNLEENEIKYIELLYQFGYREAALIAYVKLPQESLKNELKPKFVERYGNKTLAAFELTMANPLTSSDLFKELTGKIKAIFMEGVLEEEDLDKNEDYHKAQIRACLYLKYDIRYYDKYNNFISISLKKINNTGDRVDLLIAHLPGAKNKNILDKIIQNLNEFVFNTLDLDYATIALEINRLGAIADKKQLWEEIQKTWIEKGHPVMIFELIQLLRQKKLDVEAEILRSWVFYGVDNYHAKTQDEVLLQVLSVCPGFHKEAFQVGIKAARTGNSKVVNYLVAYHAFKLGHYHFAYEFLTQAQVMNDRRLEIMLNKLKFAKSDDLLQYIVSEMLATKELPEYIRFNLKDQFDVKFKK